MNLFLRLAFILLIFVTTSANATDYFYCDCKDGASEQCVSGKDSNSGLTKSLPRQTVANANSTFNRFNPGDSIQFCRGGSFTENARRRWVNNNCTSANKCMVDAYSLDGTENNNLPRPIITQTVSQNLFSLEDGGNADHEEGYIFSNLDLRCKDCTKKSWAFFLYNDVDHVVIKNIKIDGFGIGIHLSGSNKPNKGSDGTLDFITLNKLEIVNSLSQGILGGANNLTISDSYFENNGSGTIYDHNIYISRGNNILIKNNSLYRSSLDKNGRCIGVSLVVHGKIDNLIIEHNIIRESLNYAKETCWGIAVDPGYKKAESFKNIIIKNNYIKNVGNLGIGVASCNNCVIDNNKIEQQQKFRFTAISAPDRRRGGNDRALNMISIINNQIKIDSSGLGIRLGTEGKDHTVRNNAIHYTGTGKFTCFDLGLPEKHYTNIDNNTCFFPHADRSSEWELGSGRYPTPLKAWQKASAFGYHSKNTNPRLETFLPAPEL